MRSEKQKEGLSVFRQGWDCSEGSEVPQNLRRSSFSGWYRCRVCTGEKHLLKYYALSTSLTSPQFSSTLLPFSSTTVKPDQMDRGRVRCRRVSKIQEKLKPHQEVGIS